MQPILFPTSDSHVSLPILSLQVSANLKLSEKQEVKKELVSAEEGGPSSFILLLGERPPHVSPRQGQ